MGETEIPLNLSIPDLPKKNPQISNASTKNTGRVVTCNFHPSLNHTSSMLCNNMDGFPKRETLINTLTQIYDQLTMFILL